MYDELQSIMRMLTTLALIVVLMVFSAMWVGLLIGIAIDTARRVIS